MQTIAKYDFVVVGCGAAGLAAAVTYVEATAGRKTPPRIALLERSTAEARGGATRWTGAFLRIGEQRRLDPDWADRVQRVSGGARMPSIAGCLNGKLPRPSNSLRTVE
jgi:tricarballylate dehydrogenase